MTHVSDTMDRLHRARDTAWADLRPAFDHAIALAREAEHVADRLMNDAQFGPIYPSYPPLVELLAQSVPSIERPAVDPECPF